MILKSLQQPQQLQVEPECVPTIDERRWVVPSSVLKISSAVTDQQDEEQLTKAMSTIKSYIDDDEDEDDDESDENPRNKDFEYPQEAESRHAESVNERESASIPTVRSKYFEQESQLHGGSGGSSGGNKNEGWMDSEQVQSNTEKGEEPDATSAGCCSLFDSLINPLGILQCGADTTTCVVNRDTSKKARSNTLVVDSEEEAIQQADSLVDESRTTRTGGTLLKNKPMEVEDDRTLFMRRLAEDGMLLKDAPDVYKADKELILVAVGRNGRSIQFASPGLQIDKEVALVAIKQTVAAFYLISKDLWDDKDIMIAAVSHKYSSALNAATKTQKADIDIMSAAVKHNGHMLGMASREIQDNKQVVIDAVSDQGEALKYASKDLRADKEVVCAAVRNKSNALKYALGGLDQDRDCWIAAGLVVPDQGEVTRDADSSKNDSLDRAQLERAAGS